MIYTLTLNPAIDYVMDVHTLTNGRVNRSSGERIFFGGKGINVSLVLSELGINSTTLGFVGGFTGDALENELKKCGIVTDFCRLSCGITRINVKLKGEEVTEINGAGPSIDADDMDDLYSKLNTLADGDTLVLAGSIPPSLPTDTYEKILARLNGRGIKAVVDASGQLLTDTLKYKPYLIKPNIHELSELAGRDLTGDTEVIDFAKTLREAGAVNVLVSMGADGAVLLDENGCVHRRAAFKGKAVNTVGAGDSTVAGFLAGAADSYEYALLLGCAAGGATAFSEGLANKEDILRLLEEGKTK